MSQADKGGRRGDFLAPGTEALSGRVPAVSKEE